MVLGCSNLTGRYWIGSLWYYRDPSEAPSVEKALTGVDFDNGLVDGFFIDDKNVRKFFFQENMELFHLFGMFICWFVMCRLSRKVQDSYCSVQNVQD